MRKWSVLLIALIASILMCASPGLAASKIYGFTALSGSGTGALGAIDGTALADKDMAIGVVSGVRYVYYLDADSGAAEVSPGVIAPSANAGTKRWILSTIIGSEKNTPEYYGCKADSGVTDNTVCMNAALIPGGPVFINAPAGGYYKITDTLNVTVVGTRIISNTRAEIRQVTANKGAIAGTVSNVAISGLNVTGPWTLGTAYNANGDGISFTGTVGSHLSGVEVIDTWVSGFSDNGIVFDYVDNLKVNKNKVHTIRHVGIYGQFNNNFEANDNEVYDVKGYDPGGTKTIPVSVGIAFGSEYVAGNHSKVGRIFRNYVHDCEYEGVLLEPADYVQVGDNILIDNYMGIAVAGDYISLTNNDIYNLTLDNSADAARLAIIAGGNGVAGDTETFTVLTITGGTIYGYGGASGTVEYGAVHLRYQDRVTMTGVAILNSWNIALNLYQDVTNSTFTGNNIDGMQTVAGSLAININEGCSGFLDGNQISSGGYPAIYAGEAPVLGMWIGRNKITSTNAHPVSNLSQDYVSQTLLVDSRSIQSSDHATDTGRLNWITIGANTTSYDSTIKFRGGGTKTGSGGTKAIALHWGSQSVTFHAAANDTNDWYVEGTIQCYSSSVQRIAWQGYNGSTMLRGWLAGTQDTTADVMLKLVATLADEATDTVLQGLWIVERIQ